jgi:hypothetical protein
MFAIAPLVTARTLSLRQRALVEGERWQRCTHSLRPIWLVRILDEAKTGGEIILVPVQAAAESLHVTRSIITAAGTRNCLRCLGLDSMQDETDVASVFRTRSLSALELRNIQVLFIRPTYSPSTIYNLDINPCDRVLL